MHRFRRIFARTFYILSLLFILAAMILYDRGYYDFTFIKRPSDKTSDLESLLPTEPEEPESDSEDESGSESGYESEPSESESGFNS